MKKLLTLIVAGCMVLGTLGTAAAVDVKVAGEWDFSYGYYHHSTLTKSHKNDGYKADPADFRMRARTQIEFIASESLSALLNFEIGDMVYGNQYSGGGLDADQKVIEVKRAHMDWIIPGTAIRTRMGVQGIALPSVVASNPVMGADVAGISATMEFTPNIGMTAFWARPFDNSTGEAGKNQWDEMDMFGISLPIKSSVINVTPYGMVASIGKDSGYYTSNGRGIYPDTDNGSGRGRNVPANSRHDQALGWWGGVALELPILDPFFVKVDAIVGGIDAKNDYSYWGWMTAADMGYKWSWGSTSVIGFYSSGDKGTKSEPYGTLPLVSDDDGFGMTSYGLMGGRGINGDSVLSPNGVGMWGIGLQAADISFVENLNHTARVMFMRGTNSGRALDNNTYDYPESPMYLLTSDSAWEFNLNNEYVFNKYLSAGLDFAYIHASPSKQRARAARDIASDSFASVLSFQYKF